jgi:hypothetical protein
MTTQSVTHRPAAARTLTNVGTALREVAMIVTRLEDAALRTCACAADLPQKTRSLQDFDLVLQSLADLTTLIEAMGEHGANQATSNCGKWIAQMRLAWLRDLVGDAPESVDRDRTQIAIF